MGVDRSKSFKPSNKNQMAEMSTLLEKAMAFRKQNEATLEAREKERKSSTEEEDSFLDNYYKKQDEKIEKKKEYEAKRKQESPKLYIKLQYNVFHNDDIISKNLNSLRDSYRRDSVRTGSDTSDSEGGTLRTSPRDAGIFNLDTARRLSKTTSSEMTIHIVKGKYLLNWMDSSERNFDSCKIKCVLYPRSKKNGKKLKTKEFHINLKGSAKTNHVFQLQGFSTEELLHRYVELEIIGKNNQRKEVIGTIVLAGKKSVIKDSNLNCRGPVESELQPWQAAIENPGTGVSVAIPLKKVQDNSFHGESITNLSRSQLLRAKSPGCRLVSRSPVHKSKMVSK